MKRRFAAAAVLSALAALAILAVVYGARPRVLAQVGGELLSPPTGRGPWVAWLEGDREEARVVAVPRRGGAARPVLARAGLSGLAVAGDQGYVTRTEALNGGGSRSSLLRVDLGRGAVRTLAELAGAANQMICGDGWLVWREDRPGALPGVPFVLAAAPLTAVRACPREGGRIHALAVLAGDSIRSTSPVELIGIARARAYWLERAGIGGKAVTLIHRAALPDGRPETVAQEPGVRTAALVPDALLWTGPSIEAAQPGDFAAVTRRALEGSDSQVIGDWIGRDAILLASERGAYAQDRGRLWRLAEAREQQRPVLNGPGSLVTAHIAGDQEYLVMQQRGRLVIVRRPLTWWARLRALILR